MGTPILMKSREEQSTRRGEEKTYYLTPEEIAMQYGPPGPHVDKGRKPPRKIEFDEVEIAELPKKKPIQQTRHRDLYPQPEEEKSSGKSIPDDEVSWATPHKPVKAVSILRFIPRGITLNVHAHRMLASAGAEYVRVGATKDGMIVIAKTESETGSFSIGKKNKGANKIGGGALVATLRSAGAKEGRYLLEWNEDRQWWEAREYTEV